jgi:hypothetical protein
MPYRMHGIVELILLKVKLRFLGWRGRCEILYQLLMRVNWWHFVHLWGRLRGPLVLERNYFPRFLRECVEKDDLCFGDWWWFWVHRE